MITEKIYIYLGIHVMPSLHMPRKQSITYFQIFQNGQSIDIIANKDNLNIFQKQKQSPVQWIQSELVRIVIILSQI